MILRLHAPLKDLRIGVFGSRLAVLQDALTAAGLEGQVIAQPGADFGDFDIIFASGVFTLIPEKVLSLPTYGVIMFHETPLPEGRGSAPLQWTVGQGRANLTVTAFKAVAGMDAGPCVYQYNLPIEPTDTLQSLNRKREQGIRACCLEILKEMEQGVLVLREQTGSVSISPKRTPADSKLDPSKPLEELWHDIRVCDNEAFPAFFVVNGQKVVLRYEVVDDEAEGA